MLECASKMYQIGIEDVFRDLEYFYHVFSTIHTYKDVLREETNKRLGVWTKAVVIYNLRRHHIKIVTSYILPLGFFF